MSPQIQSDSLPVLRLKLKNLEETGDPASPCIASLKRIVLDRIAELEPAATGDTPLPEPAE